MDTDRYERLKAAGGLAFPTMGYADGMTLRDWFASQALAGVLAAEGDAEGRGVHAKAAQGESAATFARMAYGLADAMLAAREQPRSAT
jgi:hypothetical protein